MELTCRPVVSDSKNYSDWGAIMAGMDLVQIRAGKFTENYKGNDSQKILSFLKNCKIGTEIENVQDDIILQSLFIAACTGNNTKLVLAMLDPKFLKEWGKDHGHITKDPLLIILSVEGKAAAKALLTRLQQQGAQSKDAYNDLLMVLGDRGVLQPTFPQAPVQTNPLVARQIVGGIQRQNPGRQPRA